MMKTRDYYDLKEIIIGLRKEYLKGLQDIQILSSYVESSGFFKLQVFKTNPFVVVIESNETPYPKKFFYSLDLFQTSLTSNDSPVITDMDVFSQELLRISQSAFFQNIDFDFFGQYLATYYHFQFQPHTFSFCFSKSTDAFENSAWLEYDAFNDTLHLRSMYPLFIKPKLNTILKYQISRSSFPKYFQEKLDENREISDFYFRSITTWPMFHSSFKIEEIENKVLKRNNF